MRDQQRHRTWAAIDLPVACRSIQPFLREMSLAGPRRGGAFMVAALVVVASVAGSSCSYRRAYNAAEAATASFHECLNEGLLQQIYDRADQQLRAGTTESDFVALLAAVHRKLGRHLTTRIQSSHVHGLGRVVTVALRCSSDFEEGDAQEEFVWLVEGTSCRLASYNISSRTLVLK